MVRGRRPCALPGIDTKGRANRLATRRSAHKLSPQRQGRTRRMPAAPGRVGPHPNRTGLIRNQAAAWRDQEPNADRPAADPKAWSTIHARDMEAEHHHTSWEYASTALRRPGLVFGLLLLGTLLGAWVPARRARNRAQRTTPWQHPVRHAAVLPHDHRQAAQRGRGAAADSDATESLPMAKYLKASMAQWLKASMQWLKASMAQWLKASM